VKRLLSNRWFKFLAGLILLPTAALLSCAWYYKVWSWYDLQVYRMMSHECHPVWKDLHRGRVHAGQDVEDTIADTKPVRVERYGEFVRLSYQEALSFSGVAITAKDGRLVHAIAWSCTWHREYFDELTEDQWQVHSDAYEAHRQTIIKNRKEAEQAAARGHGER
jgi:hypothetical protein